MYLKNTNLRITTHFDPADNLEHRIGLVTLYKLNNGCQSNCAYFMYTDDSQMTVSTINFAHKKTCQNAVWKKVFFCFFLPQTNHKPLFAIFNSDKSFPIHNASRIHNILSYDFKIYNVFLK